MGLVGSQICFGIGKCFQDGEICRPVGTSLALMRINFLQYLFRHSHRVACLPARYFDRFSMGDGTGKLVLFQQDGIRAFQWNFFAREQLLEEGIGERFVLPWIDVAGQQ